MDDAIKSLEREFLLAIRTYARSYPDAEHILERLQAIAPRPLVVLLEASLLHRKFPDRKCDALNMLMSEIITTPVDDPVVAAKACVVATKLAWRLNRGHAMDEIRTFMERLWHDHGHDVAVNRWRASCEANVGQHLIDNKRFAEATDLLTQALERIVLIDQYVAVVAELQAALSIAHLSLGNMEAAKKFASDADYTSITPYRYQALYALGRIAIAEHDLDAAETLLTDAYDGAEKCADDRIMALSQVALYRVYVVVGNAAAARYARRDAERVALSNEVPHVLDAFGEQNVSASNSIERRNRVV